MATILQTKVFKFIFLNKNCCISFWNMFPRVQLTTHKYSWWRHQMETFSALLALCAGNSPVPVNSPHKGQWRGALMFSLIYAWINDWVNNREAGDLRRHRGHYDVIVMGSDDSLVLNRQQAIIWNNDGLGHLTHIWVTWLQWVKTMLVFVRLDYCEICHTE